MAWLRSAIEWPASATGWLDSARKWLGSTHEWLYQALKWSDSTKKIINAQTFVKRALLPVDPLGNAGLAWKGFTIGAVKLFTREVAMAIPTKDSLLVPYSTNWDTRINEDATLFGLTPAQGTTYTAVHTPYLAAYNAVMQARADGTWSQSLTATKDAAKADLLAYARQLYAFVQANADVSDANKILLGVDVRSSSRTPIPAPTERPGMDLVSVVGHTVKVRLHGTGPGKRRPAGCVAAWIYSFIGAAYPSDPSAWTFNGSCSSGDFTVDFPASVADGSQVWICAAYINAKQESGPISVPITATLQFAGVNGTTMKIAA